MSKIWTLAVRPSASLPWRILRSWSAVVSPRALPSRLRTAIPIKEFLAMRRHWGMLWYVTYYLYAYSFWIRYIEFWVDIYRPVFLGDRTSEWLFVNSEGNQLKSPGEYITRFFTRVTHGALHITTTVIDKFCEVFSFTPVIQIIRSIIETEAHTAVIHGRITPQAEEAIVGSNGHTKTASLLHYR